MLAHVFEPFEQADKTLDRSGGGLGLGLTLVKSLVELHGGRVEGRSGGEGTGAEFMVRLPLERREVEPASAGPSVEPRPLRRQRVLVIEDNVDAANTLSEVLALCQVARSDDSMESAPPAPGPGPGRTHAPAGKAG